MSLKKLRLKLLITSGLGLLMSLSALAVEEIKSSVNLPTAASKSDEPKPDLAHANPKTTVQLSTNIRAASAEDHLMNSKYAGGIFEIIAEQNFTSYLSGEFDVMLFVTTGTLTKQYRTSEGSAPNGFQLAKALLNLKPFSYTSLQVGVLDVEFSSILSSFDGQGFPGAREIFEVPGENLKFKLLAAQTVPTSSTAEVKNSEDGITTRLDLYTMGLSTNPDDRGSLTLEASGTYFQFQNLTASAATDSQYLGNSVTQVGSQARFKYNFEGTEWASKATYKFSRKWKSELFGSQLVNQKAPDGQNRAQLISLGNTLMTNGINYSLTVGAYNNDSDALPAAFTAGRYSFANRFGWTAMFKTEFERQKMSLFGRFVQANEEQDIIYQADRQSVFLGMEAKYDIL